MVTLILHAVTAVILGLADIEIFYQYHLSTSTCGVCMGPPSIHSVGHMPTSVLCVYYYEFALVLLKQGQLNSMEPYVTVDILKTIILWLVVFQF